MDFNEFYAKEIRLYTDLLLRNVKLYDQRDRELNSIDLSLDTLAEKYEKYLDELPEQRQNEFSALEEEVGEEEGEEEHEGEQKEQEEGLKEIENNQDKNTSHVESQAQKLAQEEMVHYNEYESSMESDVNIVLM